jgi:hypothetical protein
MVNYADKSKPPILITHGHCQWHGFVQEGIEYRWRGFSKKLRLHKYGPEGEKIVAETYMKRRFQPRVLVFDEREVDEVGAIETARLVDSRSRTSNDGMAGSSQGYVYIPRDWEF